MRTIAIIATLLAVCTEAAADQGRQADAFKVCARDTALTLIKQALASGEIPPTKNGEMFVAIEPYTAKAYASCASSTQQDALDADGLPNADIQDFVNTAAFDYLYEIATQPR